MKNKQIDLGLTAKLGIPGCYVVYDKNLGWIAEHENGHMCFMTHNKNEITQEDIDAVGHGVLYGMGTIN